MSANGFLGLDSASQIDVSPLLCRRETTFITLVHLAIQLAIQRWLACGFHSCLCTKAKQVDQMSEARGG